MLNDVFIIGGVRTAIDDFGGALKNVSCLELGKTVIKAILAKCNVDKNDVDEVIMGNVLPAGLGQNPARQAMRMAGLPVHVGALTVNKVCGSGTKAAMLASQAIALGDADVVIAGGMENMCGAPYYAPQARTGLRMGDASLVDGMVRDGLWDIISDNHMGITAENVAEHFNVSREEQDLFALESYKKAQKAWEEGKFNEEIVPVTVEEKSGTMTFCRDEVPQRSVTMEKLASLKSAFKKPGTVTAGNSSKISDGAACVLMMSGRKANELGLKPEARVVASGSAGIDSRLTVAAPIYSIPKVLKKAGLDEKEIGVHEINEAFASSTLAVMNHLHIEREKVNMRGGAISLGHPIGCSGARVIVTLLSIMKEMKSRYGMVSVCLGGGEAVSMIIENCTLSPA
jgi:acetyl-CoA C-acetyltransferase